MISTVQRTLASRVAAASRTAAACVVAAAALLAGAATSSAQDGPPPKKPPPKQQDPGKDRIRLSDDPEPAAPETSKDPAAAETAPSAPQLTEPEQWVLMLSQWPSPEARQASIRLAAQPTASWPLLERKMTESGQDWKTVCGVASTMGKIGDVRGIEWIQGKLQDRALWLHSADLLDALVRIDPVGSKARLVATLLHPASAGVEAAAERLEPRLGPADLDALRDVLEAGGPAAREAAVRLLPKTSPESRTSLAAALRDAAPEVAMAAAKALSLDESPEAEALTVRSAASAIDRQVSYAAISLALRAERTGRRTIDDPLVKLLLGGRGLAGVDPLSRTAAAIALADLGFHHEVAALEDPLDHRIPDALVDCVAATSFWHDLKVLQPHALRRIQRLTGKTSTIAPQEWRSWWEQNRASFRARRALSSVPEGTIPTFSLSVRGPKAPGAEPTTFVAGPEGLGAALPEDLLILLPADDAAALVRAVEQSGILRRGDHAADSSQPSLEITVRAGQRERRVVVPAPEADEAARAVGEAVAALRARFGWQRYRSSTQATDLAAFVATVGPKFSPDVPEAERAASLASMIASSLDDRRGEAWNLRALEELRGVPGLHDALGDEGTRSLLANLGRRASLDRTAEAIVLVLAKAQRAEAHPFVLDFLITRGGPAGRELLVRVMAEASRTDLEAAFADPRVPIRAAAIASLGPALPADLAESAARKGLDDPELPVRREAIRALGRLRIEAARERIEAEASKPGDLRIPAVEALGLLGGKSALPTLTTAFASDDPGLRIVAMKALAATREPEALSAIVFAMTYDPDAGAREVAARTVVEFGTDRAASELRRLSLDRAQAAGPRARAVLGLSLLLGKDALRDFARIVDDPAEEVGDEAACQLARWRDPVCVPRLLDMLAKGREARRARISLECVSLETFAQEDPGTLANLYAGWWETSKERGARGWIVDALVLRGIDDPALRAWETGQSGASIVPFLLRALRLPDWPVRRAADLALREMSGRSFGEQEPWTTESDVARMASAWEDFWSRHAAAR